MVEAAAKGVVRIVKPPAQRLGRASGIAIGPESGAATRRGLCYRRTGPFPGIYLAARFKEIGDYTAVRGIIEIARSLVGRFLVVRVLRLGKDQHGIELTAALKV